MKSKLIAIILSCCLMVAFVPTFAFADTDSEVEPLEQTTEDQLDPGLTEEQTEEVNDEIVIEEPETTQESEIIQNPEITQESTEQPEVKMPIVVEPQTLTDDVVRIRLMRPLESKYHVVIGSGEWNEWKYHSAHGHYGCDYDAPIGTKVYASADGIVCESEDDAEGYGKHVVIKHSKGENYSIYSLYAHLNKRVVENGSSVKQGQLIGYVGNTGHSFGAHLHFGIYKEKKYLDSEWSNPPSVGTVDPEKYLENWLAVKSEAIASTGKPKVSWNVWPGASKYKVYVKKGSNGEYKRIATISSRSFAYKKAKPGYKYGFKIKAVNSKGKVLKTSAVKYQLCKIGQPSITKISKNKSGALKIEFKSREGAYLYKLYRSESEDGTFKLIYTGKKRSKAEESNLESRYFTTKGGTVGKTYYYKIRACKAASSSANSVLSAPVSAVR